MSSSKNETATKNVLDTQRQQQQESASENEESDTVTDQSSSVSEIAIKKQKSQQHNNTAHSSHSKISTNKTTEKQFSVQSSDVDGLRMKFSAIRSTTTITTNTKINTDKKLINNNKNTDFSKKQTKNNKHINSVSNKQTQSKQLQLQSLQSGSKAAKMSINIEATTNMLPTTAVHNAQLMALTTATATTATTTTMNASCLSDATESGLSEATTTTVAAAIEKATKKIKVKRKKIAAKNSLLINGSTIKQQQTHEKARVQNEFSSDSEDDLPLKVHQQRAPRLLLTAITNHSNSLSGIATAVGSDNIGLSSSDNDLPNLVKAAIKCVESDTEDTTVEGSFRKAAAKTKNLPQYQSTLLQDFVEKTQMLGQNAASTVINGNVSPEPTSPKAAASSQSDSIASTSTCRKRRGRPKKSSASSMIINESADSGVISSTASTTQSTTPSPKMPIAAISVMVASASTGQRRLKSEASVSQTTTKNDDNQTSTSSASMKPKIDIAYLDKRMYATERVLYPPRNKRRQNVKDAVYEKKLDKDELDPVWREIDINRKFHLRNVSGYKSDGGNTTICSKILAAKSGYVSDYGSVHHRNHHSHNSGYKSDASCKSRYSTKSCVSRRSRAKSCGYRSDCKDSVVHKSNKFRRKRRPSMLIRSGTARSVTNINDEQDILQLAGLSLGQSSEESNEYVCKPSLKSLPTTSASKKYGEINRYVTTGQYFSSGGKVDANGASTTFNSLNETSQDAFISKMLMQRKSSMGNDLAPTSSRKIKSRRSSIASYCSSHYSGTSRVRRRHRRKSLSMSRISSKVANVDSKLLTEIEIITSTFGSRCRIQDDRLTASSSKEKLLAEANKLQQTLSTACTTSSNSIGNGNSNANVPNSINAKARDKRTLKKRKMSEPLVDFAMLSASAAAGGLTPSISTSTGKRRHKKASINSSPDDHKLPLKKRHYLMTPGEKNAEATTTFSSKLDAEAWAAAAAAAKTTASTKSQAQFNARSSIAASSNKSGLTPKKRHLLQNVSEDSASTSSSPLRIVVETSSISGGKLLDISPSSLCSLKQKRSRLETSLGKVHNSNNNNNNSGIDGHVVKLKNAQQTQLPGSPASYPPPGVFEPTVELEIQIPPIAKLSETAAIITKAEVDSPLLALDINAATVTKTEQSTRVVETLLHKTGGNLLLKRKRKKINRTGFPTVRRKKRKNDQLIPDVVSVEPVENAKSKETKNVTQEVPNIACERVPQAGETSETFVARANHRTPRLSVVALERLQSSPRPPTPANAANKTTKRRQKQSGALVKTQETERSKLRRTEGAAETVKSRRRKNKTVAGVDAASSKVPIKNDNNKLVAAVAASTADAAAVKEPRKVKRTKLLPTTIITTPTPVPNAKCHKIGRKAQASIKKLDTNIKLPAGIDPNTNFSCKILLKRRNSMYPLTLPKVLPLPTTESAKEVPATPEAINAEAAAKDCEILELEHDVLPLSEAQAIDTEYTTYSGDTSDEKSSNASNSLRKFMRVKRNYLPAGLFSDFFKQQEMPPPKYNHRKTEKELIYDSTTAATTAFLPPPPYCEKYFRRTVIDFELPYDIWWAYKHEKLPPRYAVPSWNYRKIRTNVYAESVRPNMAGFDHPVCNCKPDAACGDNCLNRMVYTECSPTNCPAGENCRNQKIQRHEIAPGVERFMTENKGWGVRTKLPIQKGTYILEYVGEVVTEREFKDRMGSIYLNDTHHYCLHLDGGLVIDGQRMGSDCRFVNHSCEPNCEMQKWSVNGLSRMVLFAKRNISEGEELTYDYNFSLFNPSEGQPCRCNMSQCRGVIGGKSQRIKPLPVETKPIDPPAKELSKGRQRKHKARKNTQRQQTKEVAFARVQQLSEKEKKLVQTFNIFLVRNFEKFRRSKAQRKSKQFNLKRSPTPNGYAAAANAANTMGKRRPSTPSSTIAAQISAMNTARSIKTRNLTLAGQDPEVEKMAKMAVVFRDICTALEELKTTDDQNMSIASLVLIAAIANDGNKKRKAIKSAQKQFPAELKTIQSNIEQGHYKTPNEFNLDMLQLFAESKQALVDDKVKLTGLQTLVNVYNEKKKEFYTQLLEIFGDEKELEGFEQQPYEEVTSKDINEIVVKQEKALLSATHTTNEDVIRCICGLYRDEGLMIQCSNCMVWQHTECTKADTNAENYQCERCEPREVDREIPLDEYTEDGDRYYLSLMRGDLQVRQGDAVYVLRDIPIKDADGNVIPSKKHTYETIGAIDYQECDIFRVEHLWKNDEGKRFIFGHHFLRPHETFHEPTRRFYPNEVVRVSLYELVPIELVIGRCWVLDRTTFCKGRPIECIDDEHCYICELRVDKTARFFSKAKANWPICTKTYAFRKFPQKLKISKTYAPHDVHPSMLKTKKQKTETDAVSAIPTNSTAATIATAVQQEQTNKTVRKRAAAAAIATPYKGIVTVRNNQKQKHKRLRLEKILRVIKYNMWNAQTQEAPIDLTYLLAGRGARQRKILS